VSSTPPRERISTPLLSHDPDAAQTARTVIEDLIAERAPYRRRGYPRAGAFDRLAILALRDIDDGLLGLHWWLPGPRTVQCLESAVPGRLANLIRPLATYNALILVGRRPAVGESKYGALSVELARIEQGAFLQALHAALCARGLANHIHAGLRLQALPVRCPPDSEAYMGLAV
jgi:hypothetical protein